MSLVRIYQCNTYKKQSILSPMEEPLELHTWDNLLFVSTKNSAIEIYNMSSLQLVGKFSTISQAETMIYSEYGNCIVTMERADSNTHHCFVRLYMGFPYNLSDLAVDPRVKESFVMVGLGEDGVGDKSKYITGGMTRSTSKQESMKARNAQEMSYEPSENWDVERIELPTQAAVNCVGVCAHTGLLAVAWDISITLYVLTQGSANSRDAALNSRPVRCGVSVLMEMEIGFVVTTVVVEDIYLACLSEFEAQVFQLNLMPNRYTCAPKEKKLDPYTKMMLRVDPTTEEENVTDIKQSEDFLQLRSFYTYPTIHVDSTSNARDAENYSGMPGMSMGMGDESEMGENRQTDSEEHCIIFPSVTKERLSGKEEYNKKLVEIWGPSRIIENRVLRVVTPNGHKLANSGISTMLYLKLPVTVTSCTEYSMTVASNEKGERSIEVFHTLKLIPEYLHEGDQQHLVGMCLLVASKKEGHFYDIFDYCRKINTYPFTKDLVDIVMSPGLMHVIYLSRVEVYITRSYGVASENARNLLRQGKVYNIDFGSDANTPIDEMTDTICQSKSLIEPIEEDFGLQSPLYWLYQVSPSPQEMDISQIGQSIFANLNSCTNTESRIAILSKYKPEVKPSGHPFSKLVRKNSPKVEDVIWSIYILDITPLHSIAKQMEIMAQPYIHENPPIYFQLLTDAYFLRKSAISRNQNSFLEEEEVEFVTVEPIDSLVISLTPTQQHSSHEIGSNCPRIANRQQLLGLQKSCFLLADFLRQENEQLALQYYKQGSNDLNQFLQNSILHTTMTPLSEDVATENGYPSLTPASLRSMTSNMCFSRTDASLLAKSIMYKESSVSLHSEINEKEQADCMVYKIFNLCVHFESNEELKAKQAASELILHSREFSLWANDHINSFVSQENEGNLSLLGMFLLIEVPTLVLPLLPKLCELGLVQISYTIELIKHNIEDSDRDEMVLQFITDILRKQNRSKDQIQGIELAITELIIICFNLIENQVELDTRQIDDVCAEYRPNWLDCLPPFGGLEQDHESNIRKVASLIFIVQNILCSPFNSLPMSEKILELTNSSECYDGIRIVIYMKLGRYRDLLIIFLNRYHFAFPLFCDSIQVKAVRCNIIRCIVTDILINTGEKDLLSQELRQRACNFIVSLVKCMTYKEIIEVLPEQTPADLYKRCFDFHLHIEKSDKIMRELSNTDF